MKGLDEIYGPSFHAQPTGGPPAPAQSQDAPSVRTEPFSRDADPAMALVLIAAVALALGWIGVNIDIGARVGS